MIFSYTKRHVNIVSLAVAILLYIFLVKSNLLPLKNNFEKHLISNIFKKDTILVELSTNNISQEAKEEIKEDIKEQNNIKNTRTEKNTKKETKENNWKIKIPKIELEACISEGTGKEVMDKYVGHFEETSRKSGNIGLAAHNRGYAVNYFAKIKELKEGDEITYKYNEFERTYIVIKNKIIKDTDWDDLEDTEENKITLITCVENEPEYRRCIQGIEKEGGN